MRYTGLIDTAFDFLSDTPTGKDPDSHSPTLRRYHQQMWSKPLPNGAIFELKAEQYLCYHDTEGPMYLSSDAITHSYKNTRKLQAVLRDSDQALIDNLFQAGCTFPAYTLFPAKQINRQMNINQARGVNPQIKDRFDLTLECIRRFYLGLASPLDLVFSRYQRFFELFEDFDGYVDFFLLTPLVDSESGDVKFHLPFDDFKRSALPENSSEYAVYADNVLSFITKRGQLIQQACKADE